MTTSTSSRLGPAPRRSRSCASRRRLRRARSAPARHLRFRRAGAICSDDRRCGTFRWSCSPAKSCRREQDVSSRMARKVVIKGVESPERLLDETALFFHRVIADLPPHKQQMLERLHRSDEDLRGRRCSWWMTTCATSSRSAACWNATACRCSPRRPGARRSPCSRAPPTSPSS